MPSIGADGLLPTPYHFLSHAIVAGLSTLSSMSVPSVYALWGTIGVIAQLTWTMYVVCVFATYAPAVPRPANLTFLTAGLVGSLLVLPTAGSESFVLALGLFLVLTPLVGTMSASSPDENSGRPWGLLVLAVGSVLCAVAKVSVGFFCAIGLLLVGWRRRRNLGYVACVFAALVVLYASTTTFLSSSDHMLYNISKETLWQSYMQWFGVQAVVSLMLPLVLVLAVYLRPRANIRLAANRALVTLNWEQVRPASFAFGSAAEPVGGGDGAKWQLLCLCLGGCAFVLAAFPLGSNVAYFTDVTYVLALCLTLSVLPGIYHVLHSKLFEACLVTIVCVALGLAVVDQARNVRKTARALAERLATQAGLPPQALWQDQTRRVWGLAGRDLQTPWSVLVSDLAAADAAAPGGIAVHVPGSNRQFWERMKGASAWWCLAPHLMIPAQTGIYQIRSIAPADTEAECMPPGMPFYGFQAQQARHRSGSFTDGELCRMKGRPPASAVYVLNSIDDRSANRIVKCG